MFSGTPYADPVPPNGRVAINNDFAKSDSPTVLITFDETAGASEYRISKDPVVGDEPLNAITNQLIYTLNSPDYAYVYVQFEKPSGLAGRPSSSCIFVDRSGDHDGDGLTNDEEWLTGTNPEDAADLFRVVDSRVQGASHSVTFPSLRGRTYQIYYTHDLVNEPFQAGS